MEGRTTIKEAIQLFGNNFIGIEAISKIASRLGVKVPAVEPEIPFTNVELRARANDSILLLGISMMENGDPLNILSLRERFGTDPQIEEPCFYNQDWYLNEDFVRTGIDNKWYLIRKNVFEDSRAILPTILEKKYVFPTAVLCSYTFFLYWFHTNEILWKNDYIWCSDMDHNEDKIYVGRYIDIDGINKNGFSIHRNLALRKIYAAVTVY
jgi:hypothetical protein